MSEPDPKDPNPLVRRVDALLRRRQDPGHEGEVPVLTQIVQDEARRARAVDSAALEALARELERAVLARLGPEVERVIQERLGRTLNEVLARALERARADLTGSVTQMVREAVAASVAHALAPPKQD
ncbi:MAG TPA: hypothetical protein VF943_03145 [Burkholderiales bacterium]